MCSPGSVRASLVVASVRDAGVVRVVFVAHVAHQLAAHAAAVYHELVAACSYCVRRDHGLGDRGPNIE